MIEFYKLVFSNQEFQLTGKNLFFFQNQIILTFCNNIVLEFNKFLLTKLLKDIYIYHFINSVDSNKDEMDHISQKFLSSETPSGLLFYRINLKVRTSIIYFTNYILP